MNLKVIFSIHIPDKYVAEDIAKLPSKTNRFGNEAEEFFKPLSRSILRKIEF